MFKIKTYQQYYISMDGDYSFIQMKKNEPIHIHVQKGDFEGKFWIKIEEILIEEAFCYNFTPAAKREIKKIIYQHFDLIVDAWFKNLTNPENGEIE